MSEDDEIFDRGVKAMIAEREAKFRAANEIACSTTRDSNTTAAEQPLSLSDADRVLFLSRGDWQKGAL